MAQTVKQKHISKCLSKARDRAKRDSVPFSITKEYLLSISTDHCPIFHTPFLWGPSKMGFGKQSPLGPQLDRVEPHLGYVEGNVVFLSRRANRLKDNGTMQDHYDIADWLWSHLYAKPNSTPPIPKRTNLKGIVHHESRSVLTAGFGENNYYTNHYSGTISGQDIDHSTQTSGGDSMGTRNAEVGASKTS